MIVDAGATPARLFPPNHKWVDVTVRVSVQDACDPGASCRIVRVASSEPADGAGDGRTATDWEMTGALTVRLRAERSGAGNSRIYTVTLACTDVSGNEATRDVTVVVPHDRRK